MREIQPNLSMFAVFDGHGGDKCSEYCGRNFWRHVKHCAERETDLEKVLDKAFFDVNRSFERWYHSKREHRKQKLSSGSTVTIVLFHVRFGRFV